MGLLYPVTGVKFIFASIILACLLGWMSILQRLDPDFHWQSSNHCPLSTLKASEQQSQQRALEQWKSAQASQQLNQQQSAVSVYHAPQHSKRRLRVLMGVFTFDVAMQKPYRHQFRKLFQVFDMYNDTRVCNLYDFMKEENVEMRDHCQLIWTFVVGGRQKRSAPPILLDDSQPLTLPPEKHKFIKCKDLKQFNDTTFLNIRENMNEGKSQTWFHYATHIMQQYDIDYVGKMDSDSLPYWDKFFQWAYGYLPPPPYNRGILAGVPIDKLWWNRPTEVILQQDNEDFLKEAYGRVLHLYAAGQCYIMSRDLAQVVVLEAPHAKSYQEGHEDHDISAMAFHSPQPISFHFLSLQQQFWRHPVKRFKKKRRHWRALWHNENFRMKKVLALRQERLQALHTMQEAKGISGLAATIKDSSGRDSDAAVTTEDDIDTQAVPDQLKAPVQNALGDSEDDGKDDGGGGEGGGEEDDGDEDDEDGSADGESAANSAETEQQ